MNRIIIIIKNKLTNNFQNIDKYFTLLAILCTSFSWLPIQMNVEQNKIPFKRLENMIITKINNRKK